MKYTPEQLRGWANTAELMGADITANKVALYREFASALEERQELIEALRVMYESEKDYITRNKLGDPHDNQRMKVARALLARMGE